MSGGVSFVSSLGEFGDIAGSGFSANVFMGMSMNAIIIGLQSGYLDFTGSDEYTKYYRMLPILLRIELKIPIGNLDIVPAIAVGGSYNMVINNDNTESAFEPLVLGGLGLNFNINETIILSAGVDCNAIIEKRDNYYFYMINAGIGLKF